MKFVLLINLIHVLLKVANSFLLNIAEIKNSMLSWVEHEKKFYNLMVRMVLWIWCRWTEIAVIRTVYFWFSKLTLKAPITTAADDNLFIYFYFSEKTSLEISCESSASRRRFTWIFKTCFLWKKNMNVVCYKFCLAFSGLMQNFHSSR